MAPSIGNAIRRLEVRRNRDDYPVETNWGNRDIYPVPEEQRRFTFVSYFSFWAIVGMSITAWSYGGTLLVYGLSAAEAIGCILVSSTCIGILAYLCGHPGASKHLG